jgi:hypothetical protein
MNLGTFFKYDLHELNGIEILNKCKAKLESLFLHFLIVWNHP